MAPARVRLSRAALVGPLLVLVACGGGDDDDSAAPTATDDATDTTVESTDAASADVTTTVETATAAGTTEAPAATTTEPAGPVTTLPTGSTTLPVEPAPSDSTTSPAPTTAPGAGWQDPAGVFHIEFPSEPTEQNLTAELDDGTTVPVTAYLAEVGGAAAIVSCVATSDVDVVDVDGSLIESQSQALSQFGAEVVDSSEIELQGRPGLEYRGAIGEAGAVLGRTFVDGPRVCNLLVVGEPPIVDDVAPRFLDSFEFLQEAA
jgi:hypothetical protein